MGKLTYYDEAANNFYKNSEIKSFAINSLDFHAHNFENVCKNLNDITALADLAQNQKWQGELPIRSQILKKEHTVVVTDSHLTIVYASQNIYRMNGYRPQEVLGKSPKMFQGKETCENTKKVISKAVKQQQSFEATLINYKKDGSTYKCWIQASPVFNKAGNLVNFIAFEKAVA